MVDKLLKEQADCSFLVPYGVVAIVGPAHLVFANQSVWNFDRPVLFAALAAYLIVALLIFGVNVKTLKVKRAYADVTIIVRNGVIPLGLLRAFEILLLPRQGALLIPWVWHLDNLLMAYACFYIVLRAKSLPNL
jgi:hypothetical protein